MTKKMQQLIDELEKELSDFDHENRKKLQTLTLSYDERKEKLQEFFIANGMKPVWRVTGIFDSWHLNICLSTTQGFSIARISLNRKGIMDAKLEECIPNTKYSIINAREYESICGDFTAAVNLFNNFDYEALDKKVQELDFCMADDIEEKLNITHELQKYLVFLKERIKENE